MRIAMTGTRGVPARYGGFETCVEEVGRRLVAAGHQVTVFCRPGGVAVDDEENTHRIKYEGMELVHLPVVRRRSMETLAHTALSVLHRRLADTDAMLMFNAGNAPLLPVVRARRIPVATHVDGLEWRRDKWGPTGRRYYRAAESLAVRWSDALIADAAGIQQYFAEEFGAPTELIAYGAPILTDVGSDRIVELDLAPHAYHLVIARFEPENHVREIVEGYVASSAELPLVVVGAAPYSLEYTASVRAAADGRVKFLGALFDQEQIDQLYANALTYWHGHSVGGTNPSLLRAAGAGTFTAAMDVTFNREVLGENGEFFTSPGEIAPLLLKAESDPAWVRDCGRLLQQSIQRYNWDDVSRSYEDLCRRLARREFGRRPSGRRVGTWTDHPDLARAQW